MSYVRCNHDTVSASADTVSFFFFCQIESMDIVLFEIFLTSVTKCLRSIKYSYSQCGFIPGLKVSHVL